MAGLRLDRFVDRLGPGDALAAGVLASAGPGPRRTLVAELRLDHPLDPLAPGRVLRA
ncbi:hypothetical protein [Streptomyces sp. NPDC001851]|uniref:hypothetical protein n=1 Tax=Streptomyces sp. NPDC001851 TaxID=3154529 RepID=UPI00331FE695